MRSYDYRLSQQMRKGDVHGISETNIYNRLHADRNDLTSFETSFFLVSDLIQKTSTNRKRNRKSSMKIHKVCKVLALKESQPLYSKVIKLFNQTKKFRFG